MINIGHYPEPSGYRPAHTPRSHPHNNYSNREPNIVNRYEQNGTNNRYDVLYDNREYRSDSETSRQRKHKARSLLEEASMKKQRPTQRTTDKYDGNTSTDSECTIGSTDRSYTTKRTMNTQNQQVQRKQTCVNSSEARRDATIPRDQATNQQSDDEMDTNQQTGSVSANQRTGEGSETGGTL